MNATTPEPAMQDFIPRVGKRDYRTDTSAGNQLRERLEYALGRACEDNYADMSLADQLMMLLQLDQYDRIVYQICEEAQPYYWDSELCRAIDVAVWHWAAAHAGREEQEVGDE